MRIYFTSDIHASQKCWRKFLAAPKFYEADVIIVGGDITGKFVVPIIGQPDGTYRSNFLGLDRRVKTEDELERLKAWIADAGSYAFVTTPEEHAEHEGDQQRIDELFRQLALERVREWVKLADERLAGLSVRCFVSGANDDIYEVDEVLAESETIEVPEGRVVELDGFEMASVGFGNPTPWNCPRDLSEEELAAKIEDVAARVTRPDRAIFNLHVPPYDSGLDYAPKLDENLRVVVYPGSAEPQMVPVGSTAVRDAILEHRPMLSLHGHIHESPGIKRIGATTAVNPGSQYGEGILDGALVDLDPKKGLVKVQLVSG
jgi:Icc-related predicted phosphoesterase